MASFWRLSGFSLCGADVLQNVSALWGSYVFLMLLCISVSDVLWRRVSNKMVLCCMAATAVMWLQAFGARGLAVSMLSGTLSFLMALVIYDLGLMGAADVKVLFVFGACVGPGALVGLWVYGALFAGLMGLVSLYKPGPEPLMHVWMACLQPRGALDRARKKGQTIPLTVALSCSVFVLLWGGAPWRF